MSHTTLYSDTLFEGVPIDEPVIVAVSGGSDSMALLLLAQSWALRKGGELQVVTIDHGLRPEAAAEAAFVAGICARMDLPHSTLSWEGIKPSFGIQEAARVSRYALLDDFAHEIGASVILTGHNLDDQAETVFMRAGRLREAGDGDGRGLSGMARVTQLYGGTRIVRPVLGLRRQALRSFLIANNQSWVEDPSNQDASYERVQVRRFLSASPDMADNALRLGSASGQMREALSRSAAILLAHHARVLPGPVFELDLPAGMKGPLENPVLRLAIRSMLALAGGRSHLVAQHRLGAIANAIDASRRSHAGSEKPGVQTATLGGAVVTCEPLDPKPATGRNPRGEASKPASRQNANSGTAAAVGVDGNMRAVRLHFIRESRNLTSILLEPGEAAVWDGRMHLYNGTDRPVFVEPADRRLINEIERQNGNRIAVEPRRALLSTPVLHVQEDAPPARKAHAQGNRLPILPLVESGRLPRGLEVRIACVAIEHFCPQWDFALRDWIRSLDSHASASLQP